LLPTVSAYQQAGYSRALKEMCDEYETNLTRVCTAILHNTAIFNTVTFMVYILNVCAYFKAAYQVNTNDTDNPANPFIYREYRALSMALTLKEARFYFKMHMNTGNHCLFCWITQTSDKLVLSFAFTIFQPKNHQLVLQACGDNIVS
jgi:hypothetical protein